MRLLQDDRGRWLLRVRPGKCLGPHESVAGALMDAVSELEMQIRRLERLLRNHMDAHERMTSKGKSDV